jgi:hypothetical protein
MHMVAGYHLIWTAYGWWLPNNPRGSSSPAIGDEQIAALGDCHYGRKVVQPGSAVIRDFYEIARDELQHPLLTVGPDEIAIIGRCFEV